MNVKEILLTVGLAGGTCQTRGEGEIVMVHHPQGDR